MAISYNDWKKKYEWLNDAQRQNYLNMTKNDATAQQYMTQYNNEKNTVYTPSTTQNVTQPTNTFWDTGWASQAKQYTGTWVTSAGNYNYNPNLKTNQLTSGSLVFWTNAENTESRTPWYLEQRNNAIANALYNEWKTDRQSVENYLLTFDDYKNYDDIGRKNTIDAIMNRFWTMDSLANKNSPTQWDMFDSMRKQAVDNYNQSEKWLWNIMWGENYAKTFDEAVANKLNSAFWMDLNEFKSRYPDQYDSLIQSLETIRGTWDATDPTQRQLLDWYLQQVIWASVWAGSDISKLKRFEESIKSKFKNPDKMSEDMRNIVKLQTEWKSISEIANEMWISEEQVNNAILAYNWLDNELWKFYTLTDEAAKKVTEPYDIKQQRLDEEKKIALDRANRNVEWLKQDYDTNMERQKKQNDINAHNADAIAWRTGLSFSKRGIEWINYVNDQWKQILDDLTKNYDRNNIQMADGIADIIRNYNYNTQDITKASEEALTRAKNNYTANVLAIQQQYWTVWLQAQQAIANSVQNFIQQAENIFDNDLQRRQQNLSNLIDNVANINALQVQNLALRNQQIAQFQTESLNYNRSQLQQLASQLWMWSEDYQALINYQVQATADMLNNYAPWTWYTFQNEIKSLLDQWYTPNEAVWMIAKSQAFQQATVTQNTWTWHSAGNGFLYNDNWDIKQIEWFNGTAWTVDNYWNPTYLWEWSQNYFSSAVEWLQSFANEHTIGSHWGQCWAFVNDYLQSLGLSRVFTDPITDKTWAINTQKWYIPQVWDVAVMDSPSAPQYWHVAIVTGVEQDWKGNYKITTLESNKKWEESVFTRTFTPSTAKNNSNYVYWYYHPEVQGNVNTAWDWAISDDWVTPISYRQRIYNLVPTSLKNSDTELKNLYATAKTLYQKWYTADEAALTFYWLDIKKDKTWLMNNLLWIARSSWSDLPDSFYWNLWQYLESWNAEQAIKLVENTVLWKEWAALEKNWISLVSKIKNVQEKLEEAKKYVWPINWTFTQYINKLKSNKKYQSLATAITNAYADVQKELMWSNLTEWEKSRYAPMFPEMSDKYDNIATKLQATIDNVLANVNWTRQYYSLPGLDTKTLLSNKERIWLYNWTYTIWWDNTVFKSLWTWGGRMITWWGRS